jgi:serine/threonine-protein kinase
MNQIAMDRWATVKHIHHGALDKDPSERAAFLDESCGGDETLRREVQSLLMYATEAESFLERPAVDVAPTRPSAPRETALVGRRVSHYQSCRYSAPAVWARSTLHETRDWIELSR